MSTEEVRQLAEEFVLEFGVGAPVEDVFWLFPELDETEAEEVWEMSWNLEVKVVSND